MTLMLLYVLARLLVLAIWQSVPLNDDWALPAPCKRFANGRFQSWKLARQRHCGLMSFTDCCLFTCLILIQYSARFHAALLFCGSRFTLPAAKTLFGQQLCCVCRFGAFRFHPVYFILKFFYDRDKISVHSYTGYLFGRPVFRKRQTSFFFHFLSVG